MIEDAPQVHNSKEKREEFKIKSIEDHIALKNAMIADVGMPEEIEAWSILLQAHPKLTNFKVADNEIADRSKGNALKNFIKDKFKRKPLDEGMKNNLYPGNRESVKNIKTEDLEDLRAQLLSSLEKVEPVRDSLDLLVSAEIDPEVKKLVEKYGKSNISELLQPGMPVSYHDMLVVISYVGMAFNFRNRKIAEFVAYRYARTAPSYIDIQDFIMNAHEIATSEKSNGRYRSTELESGGQFNVPVSAHLLPVIMKIFSDDVSDMKTFKKDDKFLKECFKKYLLFEIIHPFTDGNGRTGRALFAHLQKRFKANDSNIDNPVHIPIARYESGTAYPSDKKKQKADMNLPGSLSLDINTSVANILQSQEFAELNQKYSQLNESNINHFYNEVCNILESEKVDSELDAAVSVIKRQSDLDDLDGSDWNMVYRSAKKHITSMSDGRNM